MNMHIHGSWFFVSVVFSAYEVKCVDIILVSQQDARQIAIHALLAQFGPALPDAGLQGYVERSRPITACSPLTSPSIVNSAPPYFRFLLIQQGPCAYTDQVHRAEAAGYGAVIVFSNSSDELILMRPRRGEEALANITIPSLFIGQMDGILLWDKYHWSTGYSVQLTSDVKRSFVNASVGTVAAFGLLAVSVVVVPLLLVCGMTIFGRRCTLIYKIYKDAKKRTETLTFLPERFFKAETNISDNSTACSICLENFLIGEKIRTILPCLHEFHSNCVDRWLLRHDLLCPLCRREVRLPKVPDKLADKAQDSHAVPIEPVSAPPENASGPA